MNGNKNSLALLFVTSLALSSAVLPPNAQRRAEERRIRTSHTLNEYCLEHSVLFGLPGVLTTIGKITSEQEDGMPGGPYNVEINVQTIGTITKTQRVEIFEEANPIEEIRVRVAPVVAPVRGPKRFGLKFVGGPIGDAVEHETLTIDFPKGGKSKNQNAKQESAGAAFIRHSCTLTDYAKQHSFGRMIRCEIGEIKCTHETDFNGLASGDKETYQVKIETTIDMPVAARAQKTVGVPTIDPEFPFYPDPACPTERHTTVQNVEYCIEGGIYWMTFGAGPLNGKVEPLGPVLM